MRDLQRATNIRLAAEGGQPVRTAPLSPWPHFDENEIQAATDVLRSGNVNYWSGQECRRFEAEFAESVGTKRLSAEAS